MHQLTYISTATEDMTDADLDQILATSRRNNRRDGVTGVLIYDGRRFLQALEGDLAHVEPAFLRIDRDPRHRAVSVLSIQTVDERQFGDWDMASHRAEAAREGSSLADTVEALVANLADENMRALFRRFADGAARS